MSSNNEPIEDSLFGANSYSHASKQDALPRVAELNWSRLSWDGFEQLCAAMLDSLGFEKVDRYGVPGQKQDGIDIEFSRLRSEQRGFVQCKFLTSMSVADLKDAVQRFKEGSFYSPGVRFEIWTSADTSNTRLQSAYHEIDADVFKVADIDFRLVGRKKIEHDLRVQKSIVATFFSGHEAEEFCVVDEVRSLFAGFPADCVSGGETLLSNVIPITRIPKYVCSFRVQTKLNQLRPKLKYDQLRAVFTDEAYSLQGDRLFILSESDTPELPSDAIKVIEPGRPEAAPSQCWSDSSSDENRRHLSRLILSAVSNDVRQQGLYLRRHRNRLRLRFTLKATREGKHEARRLEYRSLQNRASRVVCKMWRKNAVYHESCDVKVEQVGSRWCLVLMPTVEYTFDGKRLHKDDPSFRSEWKRKQSNGSVVHQVHFWHLVLTAFGASHPQIRLGRILAVDSPVGLHEQAWRAQEE